MTERVGGVEERSENRENGKRKSRRAIFDKTDDEIGRTTRRRIS